MQFFSFLLIIFFVEIAVGIMVYFQASSYDQIIGESVKQTVQHNYQTNNTAAMQTFDLVQEGVSMSTLTYLCSIILHATTSLVQCFEICAPNPKVSCNFSA